ncbi:hypothetical protein C8A05DRAFT_45882 [Staphylotrichum tortipilum]|uniref:Uncharacterized protein n=1 Tax=Staphylotrichum tortipilum TaxID=2831512 RepID=A0AAN6MG28_9PEZI|nr:hypothetical protein C8A05DRAFT_45882 [Staphylotrichum longicolle]
MTAYLSHPPAPPAAPAPRYTPSPTTPREFEEDVELARLDSISPSLLSAPPPYDASTSPFQPTLHLQIETPGKPWLSLPLPPRPDPIPVFALHPSDPSTSAAATSSTTPKFLSLRPERCSGSCYLVSPATTATTPSSSEAPIHPLATTTYPSPPPPPPPPLAPSTLQSLLSSKDNPTEDATPDLETWDAFPLVSAGLLTRATTFRTRLGTFSWRYAGRRERRQTQSQSLGEGMQEGGEVSNLLVLERVVRVATARNAPGGSSRGDEEVRTVVARFVRGPVYRTPGSGGSSAGNGGRLVVDLGRLVGGQGQGGEGDEEGDGEGVSEKGDDREMAVVMVVVTCLVMLKREVDRRRAQQIAIAAGAGGS